MDVQKDSAEMPDVYLYVLGEVKGPYHKEQVEDLLSDGQITMQTLMKDSTMEEWKPVGEEIGSSCSIVSLKNNFQCWGIQSILCSIKKVIFPNLLHLFRINVRNTQNGYRKIHFSLKVKLAIAFSAITFTCLFCYLLSSPHVSQEEANRLGRELYYAIEYCQPDRLVQLITRGANLNIKDDLFDGRTPLMWAIQRGESGYVRTLVAAGADVDAKDGLYGDTALIIAATQKNAAIVKCLLEAGADVNARNKKGESAVMLAAYWRGGDGDVVRLMLDAGANVKFKDNNGETLFSHAASSGLENIVKLLLDKGMNVNSTNHNGVTPLMLAVHKGHNEVVNMLLENGADVNCRDKSGGTALTRCALNGHTRTASILLQAGADVNAQSNNGTTALMRAAKDGNVPFVKLLVEAGANLDSVDESGNSALSLAQKRGHDEVVRILQGSRECRESSKGKKRRGCE